MTPITRCPAPQPPASLQLQELFTDFETLCQPHVGPVRDVLTGRSNRYKLRYQDTVFVFHHGCLMSQVLRNGLIRALPPFGLDTNGNPYLVALPEHQQHWLDEFMQLPKDVLLFYFSLLQQVFEARALRGRREEPDTGKVSWHPVPTALREILAEVDWPTR